MEREIRAEFQNLHNFLDEEEDRDLERLRKERDRRVKLLKERERKIAMQGRDLEKAIETLNTKLAEDDSPKLLKVLPLGLYHMLCLLSRNNNLLPADLFSPSYCTACIRLDTVGATLNQSTAWILQPIKLFDAALFSQAAC